MKSVYVRGGLFFLCISVCMPMYPSGVKVARFIAKCAVPAIKYGLPALPFAYLAIREGIARLHRLKHVEKAVKNMHSDLDCFRNDTENNFVDTRNDVEDSKNKVLKKVEKTKNTLKRLIEKTDEHIGFVEENIRGDIQKVKNSMLDRLKKVHADVKNCATHEEIKQLKKELLEFISSVKKYATMLLSLIKNSEENQKRLLKELLDKMEVKNVERFESLVQGNKDLKELLLKRYQEISDKNKEEMKKELIRMSHQINKLEKTVGSQNILLITLLEMNNKKYSRGKKKMWNRRDSHE